MRIMVLVLQLSLRIMEVKNSDISYRGKETILVAEDDTDLRKLIKIVLENFGYKVINAEDGEEAIAKFIEKKENVKLIILDMAMPKKSGKEVCEMVRKTDPGIKILFMSGYTQENIKAQGVAISDFGFIQKPILPMDLVKKVREVLDVTGIEGS